MSLAPIDGFVLLTATSAVTAGAGDITSILLGVPGEATAAAIVADGHALAVRGEGRYATGAAISASMMGALFGMGVLVAFIPLAPRVLAHVGSPELAALAIVGICLLVPLSHSDPVKGLFSGALGLALATVGLDPFRAEPRFTFAQLSLWDGLGLLPVALGIFAVAEALAMIRSRDLQEGASTQRRPRRHPWRAGIGAASGPGVSLQHHRRRDRQPARRWRVRHAVDCVRARTDLDAPGYGRP